LGPTAESAGVHTHFRRRGDVERDAIQRGIVDDVARVHASGHLTVDFAYPLAHRDLAHRLHPVPERRIEIPLVEVLRLVGVPVAVDHRMTVAQRRPPRLKPVSRITFDD